MKKMIYWNLLNLGLSVHQKTTFKGEKANHQLGDDVLNKERNHQETAHLENEPTNDTSQKTILLVIREMQIKVTLEKCLVVIRLNIHISATQ